MPSEDSEHIRQMRINQRLLFVGLGALAVAQAWVVYDLTNATNAAVALTGVALLMMFTSAIDRRLDDQTGDQR